MATVDTSDQKKVISHLLAIIRRGLTHLFHILTVGAMAWAKPQINLRSALLNLLHRLSLKFGTQGPRVGGGGVGGGISNLASSWL